MGQSEPWRAQFAIVSRVVLYAVVLAAVVVAVVVVVVAAEAAAARQPGVHVQRVVHHALGLLLRREKHLAARGAVRDITDMSDSGRGGGKVGRLGGGKGAESDGSRGEGRWAS